MNTPDNFCGGKTRMYFTEWCKVTSDKDLLNWIRGIKLDFINDVQQEKNPPPIHFSETEKEKMNVQILRMLDKDIALGDIYRSSLPFVLLQLTSILVVNLYQSCYRTWVRL